ncbi:bumetanide-sensitive sodium-(potassium)-chloride cotransporter-like isoform X2 [Zootermopsis nevadensis]|uniref:bumetanide-sensitive sodium-(potassium)-chloride cotransporter-like isoform X2 n=1 Tax=Zootermopsis nevadensis TaxID=136037 RepID=UPI000B8E82A6|nr:bumetanide-sensitive sodium-(potassium)-chloride cotransporter-like isoform X2 [Zootermopsis nevadensis]
MNSDLTPANDPALGEQQELQDIDQNRFRVAKVDAKDDEKETDSLTSPNLQHSYGCDSRYKSLGQLTREVPPRVEHYRHLSIHHEYRPTLEELHERIIPEKRERNVEAEPQEQKKGKVIKFGWLEGVFMRCLLNIWGVMLFLRLSWVIGQAGIGEGTAIICLANIVTLVTSISMSAVCTNGQIKGGGIYYMISRSLGPEFGGAIGLMFTLANSVAVSMYIVGFCESLQDLLRSFGTTIIDGASNDIRVVGLVTLIGIFILAIVGMDWVTRTQMCLLFVLIASQIDFVIGSFLGPEDDEEIVKGFVGYNVETFVSNLYPDYRNYEGVDHDFFSVFSVFFPAVTGIVAGANLSGDLKDPSSAIPIGTLLAIVITFLSYVGYGFMMGGCVLRTASGNVTEYLQVKGEPNEWTIFSNCTDRPCMYGLHNDNQAMELASSWGPLIYGGCFAATLSSAIASLVGAPRVLQALAKDKLYPLIGFFSKGHGANNDPVRGYILVFVISFGCILIAQLNVIAPLLSNFFLAAYALINFSVFHASISKSPGWRPAFKYYNAWVSLIGTLLCIAVMFLMSWVMALFTFVVVITLYLYVSYRKPEVNWGSSTQAHSYSSALKAMLELNRVEEHVKNFRPQVLVLTGMPGSRPPLVDFAYLITKGLSLLVCAHILKATHSQRVHEALTKKAYQWLIRHKVKAFFCITEDDSFEAGCQVLMQISGLGKLRPNMILMGYKGNWRTCDPEELKQYFNVIHNALDRYLAVGILRVQEGLDYSGIIQDEEFVPISTLDKKDAEEKMRRNQSSNQLVSQDVNISVLSDALNSDTESPSMNCDPVASDSLLESSTTVTVTSKKSRKTLKTQKSNIAMYVSPGGEPLPKSILNNITQFQRKQPKGLIDVWWLYDDGGLTLLIPYILSTRSQFSGCQLRIFSLASKGDDLDNDQRNLAALLSKFRIDYSDVVIISDIHKKAMDSTRKEFETFIEPFRVKDGDSSDTSKTSNKTCITESELLALKEKTNRHMRIRELLLQYSMESTFIVMALPIPRKDVVSAPLYMAWLELLTKGMPPCLIIRGNQTSVITVYS